jgi:hypothetical protein
MALRIRVERSGQAGAPLKAWQGNNASQIRANLQFGAELHTSAPLALS